jgi:RNA polymerase sigma factor for flagellar operon FliA
VPGPIREVIDRCMCIDPAGRYGSVRELSAALRQFERRCLLSTYVTVVVTRLFVDWRNKHWGRWRPSVEAKRLGPAAILIEQLVVRDSMPLDQAIETARINHHVNIDDALQAFCNTLSARTPSHRLVSEENAIEVASAGPAADVRVVMAEREFLAKRVSAALDRARQALPAMERLILKMLFEDRMTIANIARALNIEQRPLYRTRDDLKAQLRASLEAEGISRADIEALLDAPAIEWEKESDGPMPPSGDAGRVLRRGTSWRSR